MTSDASSPSGGPTTFAGEGEAAVSSFITFVILLGGVVGGLVLVVLVLLVCKYCVKGKRIGRRSLRDGSREVGRPVRVVQHYETIHSEGLSDPSTTASMDGIPLSPRKFLDFRTRGSRRDENEEANERTYLRASYEKDHLYDHQRDGSFRSLAATASGSTGSRKSADHVTLKDETEEGGGGGGGVGHRSPCNSANSNNAAATTITNTNTSTATSSKQQEGSGGGGGGSGRELMNFPTPAHLLEAALWPGGQSFPLDILKVETPPSEADRVEENSPEKHAWSGGATVYVLDLLFGRKHKPRTLIFFSLFPKPHPTPLPTLRQYRYTEGDFHHLKYAKITALPRQFSLGPPSPSLGATAPSSAPLPPRPLPLLGTAACEKAFRYSLDERLRMLQEDTEKSFPPIQPAEPPSSASSSVVGGGGGGGKSSSFSHEPSGGKHYKAGPPLPPPPSHETFRHENSRHENFRRQHSVAGCQDMPKKHLPQKQQALPRQATLKHQHQQHHPQQQHQLQRQGTSKHEAAMLTRPVPKHVQRTHAYQQKSGAGRGEEGRAKATRKVKSYEDVADYDVLQITEFSRGPFYNTDYDVISELASPTSSKVRYNDTGSLEELQEEAVEGEVSCLALEALLPPDDLDDTITNNNNSDSTTTLTTATATSATLDGSGSHQNREIWHLRATLEEEEECSDTVRMEDGTSPDDSPEDRDHVHTTSFESTVPSDACTSDQRDSGIQWEGRGNGGGGGVSQLLHPNYENRRQTYRNLLSGRLARSPAGPPPGVAAILSSASADNSFDSVETDGDVSDTSRHEVTTTSFESTTDNTDSTTESQHSRLRQMKTDSGYKSLETQQSGVREAVEAQVELHHEDQRGMAGVILERGELRGEPEHLEGRRGGGGGGGGQPAQAAAGGGSGAAGHHGNADGGGGRAEVAGGRRNSNAMHFERRAGRTASKKRREYSRERQAIHVYESVQEPETDSIRSDAPSGDSFEDSGSHQHKRSIFTRFFSYGHSRDKYMVRDYSIDEKTNKIFNEFLRQELPEDNLAGGGGGGSSGRLGLRRSPRSQHRPRLQRKHTEPLYRLEDRRRDRLAPEMRSASLGSDSSASSVRKLSPQDSIEEEYEEEGEAEKNWRRTELAPMMEVADTDSLEGDLKAGMFSSSASSKALHDIPVIKLPEAEVPNPS
ncbi:uncharacterized protein LOC143280294 [Babylonia areolata]|uniref:uncharacterized protein LOC143280294 n=1 Tax=Babylonia areolata TaxID=304850 RepID=UPI003FD65855